MAGSCGRRGPPPPFPSPCASVCCTAAADPTHLLAAVAPLLAQMDRWTPGSQTQLSRGDGSGPGTAGFRWSPGSSMGGWGQDEVLGPLWGMSLPARTDRLPGDWVVGQDSTSEAVAQQGVEDPREPLCSTGQAMCPSPPGCCTGVTVPAQGSAAVGWVEGRMGSQALPCSSTRSWGQGQTWPNVAAGGGLRRGGPDSGDSLQSPPGAAPPVPCTRQSQTCSGAGQ